MNRTLVLFLALLPAHAAMVREDRAPAPADLGALLREAETASPLLRAAAARLESARRGPSQARTLPDPEATVSYLNDGVSRLTLGESEFSSLSLAWTQEVPYPGKRDRSGEVAAAMVEISARDLERARLEVAAVVKAAYAELYRLDMTRTILDETRSVLESLAQAARRRYEVGEGIQESVLKAQTEILRLEAESARVAQDRRSAEVRLNAALGREADTPLGPASLLPEASLPGDPEGLADIAVTASPAIGALTASVHRGEAAVQRARLDLKPDFIWSAAYQNRGGLDPMVMGSIGLRLPIYSSRKQALALEQAELELSAARHDLEDLRVGTRAAVRVLVSRVQQAERLRVLFGQGVIPQARRTLESAQSSYGVGRLPFLDLLNDLTALLGARIDLAAQESDRLQALAALEPLVARPLINVPGDRAVVGDDDVHDR